MTWENFTIDEFRCKCGCMANEIKFDFVDKLQRLRTALGFPLHINSGYRCPEHNERVSTTGRDGPHTTGRAVDISVDRVLAHELLTEAIASNDFTGFGFKQHGVSRFIHLDDLEHPHPRPIIWSYP